MRRDGVTWIGPGPLQVLAIPLASRRQSWRPAMSAGTAHASCDDALLPDNSGRALGGISRSDVEPTRSLKNVQREIDR